LSEATWFKGQTVAGDTQPTSPEPFKHYAQRWLTTDRGRTGRGLSDTTRETYADALRRVAVPYFGTARMDDIAAPIVRDYIAHLASKGPSPATVRRYLAPLRALIATAYEGGAIPTNPAAGGRAVVTDHRSRRRRPLTPEQTRALLAEMPPSPADLAYFLAASGVRISEALAAGWRDLEQDSAGRPVLAIPKSKTPSGERILRCRPRRCDVSCDVGRSRRGRPTLIRSSRPLSGRHASRTTIAAGFFVPPLSEPGCPGRRRTLSVTDSPP
jgi:integrase